MVEVSIDAVLIRHHGDLHLGQVLFTGDNFVIIDFEGEPARPHSTNYGYVDYLWKGHPLANKSGTIMEHWIVFFQEHHYANWVIRARKIGATLHHKNGKRNDNRPENLELRWPGRHPYGWTTDAMIETLEMMGFVVRRPN